MRASPDTGAFALAEVSCSGAMAGALLPCSGVVLGGSACGAGGLSVVGSGGVWLDCCCCCCSFWGSWSRACCSCGGGCCTASAPRKNNSRYARAECHSKRMMSSRSRSTKNK